ncbi:MAG: 30S ribosomal protein S12 methylthiotransferase RimO, partial [Clostridia bacterium]|nr:30S ribosomal protein S12 methylthiotransferase RimO [Clostridia bacterium]
PFELYIHMSKIGFISLGCSKNLVDTEIMIGLAEEKGHEIVTNPREASILIINTCGFIDDAKTEAIEVILEHAAYKKIGKLSKLIVTGCLAQRYKDEIIQELPEVDMVIGVDEFPSIMSLLEKDHGVFVRGNEAPYPEGLPRHRTTPPYLGYLKIAEGCDNHCTYCAIPAIRGSYRSRPMDAILEEARNMYAEGVQELCIIAQDTTRYGTDLNPPTTLANLLDALADVGFPWIRVFYTYADRIDKSLLQVIAKRENIVKYLDIPVQHISDSVLRRMGRRDTEASIKELLHLIRCVIPDVTLRTSLIVGFPGETEADFRQLCNFVASGAFERIGIFRFSPEEGTAAEKLPDQIPDEIKESRYNTLMKIAQKVSKDALKEKIGKIETVLTEGFSDLFYVGRSTGDGPDIDGKVYFTSVREHLPGDFVQVKILHTEEYDLIGEMTDECAQ